MGGFGFGKGANSAGVFETSNRSTTPLNAGGTYTGEWVECIDFPSVTTACLTDQNGSLYIDFSNDGASVSSSLLTTITANVNDVHRYTVTRRYVRVRLINSSASNQTSLDLSLILGYQSALTSAINSLMQSDADGIVTRPLDFNLMVSEGLYQNRLNTIKDGYTPSLSSGAITQDVWTESGAYTGFPASADSAELIIAGADTGTVYYSYLATTTDTEYTFGSKAITGAATYSLGHNIYRCNFMYFVSSTSTTAFNVGKMTIRHVSTPTNVFCTIDAGRSQSFCAAYTVPYQNAVYIDRFQGSMRGGVSGSLDGFIWYRDFGGSPRLRFPFELQFGSLYFDDVDYLIKIPERTDIIPRVINASANNLVGKFTYRLIKNRTL